MTEQLCNEFPPVPTQQWEAVIEKDLKGADYAKKLVWKTIEGIALRPYYRREDLQELKYLNTAPGAFPFVRGTKEHNQWLIHQSFLAETDYELVNQQALEGLAKGVESVGFGIDCTEECSQNDMAVLLKDINLNTTPVHFEDIDYPTALSYIHSFVSYAKQQNVNPQCLRATFGYHPLSCFTIQDLSDYPDSMDCLKHCIEAVRDFPQIRVVGVLPYNLHAAGAHIVQELAFGLAMGSEYMNHLVHDEILPDEAASRFRFTFGVGSNYFLEIAKFRAARLLWANVVQAYGVKNESALKMEVHAITSRRNQTMYDPYVNMLRGTTEAMSAAIAGVDSLEVTQYDSPIRDPDNFSNRIARNTQIILKEEAYFDKVVDPSAGSYYIENLTKSIAEEAWKLFTEIEGNGGYISACIKGQIQTTIKATAQKRANNLNTRKDILLGTNQFPNFTEKSSPDVTSCFGFPSAGSKDLPPYRDAEAFEELRFTTETSGKTPKVFMLTFGHLAMCRARAQFACNFFAVAGFEVIDNNRFASIEEGVSAALSANAQVVVACSADDEYETNVPHIAELLGSQAILVVAGDPECKPVLESKGVTHFISVKSNVLETLKQYQQEVGI